MCYAAQKPCFRAEVLVPLPPSCGEYFLLTVQSLPKRIALHLTAPSQKQLTSNVWLTQA